MLIRDCTKKKILKKVTPYVAHKIYLLKQEHRCSYVELADNLGVSPQRLSELVHHYRLEKNVLSEAFLETLIVAEIITQDEILKKCKLQNVEVLYIESLGRV